MLPALRPLGEHFHPVAVMRVASWICLSCYQSHVCYRRQCYFNDGFGLRLHERCLGPRRPGPLRACGCWTAAAEEYGALMLKIVLPGPNSQLN